MKIACALKEQLFTSVDGASLAFFRIGFCFLLYYDMVRYGPRLSYTYFSTTEFTFKYFGFEWVQPLPSALLIGLFVVLAILALCFMLGFYYRLSIGLFTLGYTYIFLLDQGYYLNHFYMVILFCLLLCVVPAHSCWSIDKRQNQIDTGGTVPAWSLPSEFAVAQNSPPECDREA